jgi:hypothetical protein
MATAAVEAPVKVGMNTLHLSASLFNSFTTLLGALAWPALVLLLMFLFRRQIVMLANKLASFEGFGVKLNFNRAAQNLAVATISTAPPTRLETLDPLALQRDLAVRRPLVLKDRPDGGPSAAEIKVLQAWVEIERALRVAAETNAIEADEDVAELVEALVGKGKIGIETASLVEDAQQLRDAVVHGQAKAVSFLAAETYTLSATRIIERIRVEAGVVAERR